MKFFDKSFKLNLTMSILNKKLKTRKNYLVEAFKIFFLNKNYKSLFDVTKFNFNSQQDNPQHCTHKNWISQ
jgi:hypothetical protein